MIYKLSFRIIHDSKYMMRFIKIIRGEMIMNMKGFYRVNRPKVLILLFTVSILLVVVPVTATNAL